MKNVLLTTIFLAFTICSFSQDTPDAFSNRINYIFQNVNKNQIPTGILQEYGVDFTNVNNYNGLVLNDSNKVILNEWRSLYNSLYTSQINSIPNLPLFSTIESKLDTISANSLLIMHYNFNTLKSDAIANNLMYVSNDQIFDVPGRAQSPYNQESAFAICANNAWFENENVSLIFRQQLFYTNTGKTISSLYLDGGCGYQLANWNIPVTFHFNAVGIHTIKAKIVYSDASTYESHFNVHVKNIGSSLKSLGGIQIQDYIPAPDIPITATRTYSGTPASGRIQILKSQQNGGVIRKPLIVAEGFDPSIILKTENLNISSFMFSMNSEAGMTLQQDLNLAGYDIIYLDYNNGTDYIQNNAYLLQDVIKWVNLNKAANADSNVILGMSMGALVARWALKDMEDRNENHNVRLSISFDGPHNGAYVPLSAIAMVNGIHDFKFSLGLLGIPIVTLFDASEVKPMYNLLNSPASKQMLTYNLSYNSFNQTYSDNNATYNAFMSEYHNKGLPSLCKNIAISNGSSCGTSQTIPAGAFYVNVNSSTTLNWIQKAALFFISPYTLLTNKPKFAISGLIGILPNKTSLSAQIKLGALSTLQSTEIYKAQIGIKRKIFWLINVNTYLINNSYNSGSKLPLDASPGGIYSLASFTSGLPPNLAGYLQYNSFCFVPTVSALDLSTNISQFNPYHLTYAYQDMGRAMFPKPSPFSSINVGYQGNEDHISFKNKNAKWLFSKMQRTSNSECYTACANYASINIAGDAATCAGSYYNISSLPEGSTIAWSINSTTFAKLSVSGNTANISRSGSGSGSIVLTAIITTPCGVVTKTKGITMGTEKPTITGMSPGFTFSPGILPRTLTATGNYPPGTIYIWGKEGQVQITSGLGTNTIVLSMLSHGAQSPNTFSVYCAVVRPDCNNSSNSTSLHGFVMYPPKKMTVYPNPVSNELTITLEESEKKDIGESQRMNITNIPFDYKLYNEKGMVLKSGKNNINENKASVHFSDIPNGIYYLHIIEGKEILKKQIIVQH